MSVFEEMEETLAELERRGVGEVRIDYSGGGDEGSINDVTATSKPSTDAPVDVSYLVDDHSVFEDWAYNLIDDHHPGWEIDEGSSGHISIDVPARTAKLVHHDNIVTTSTTTAELA